MDGRAPLWPAIGALTLLAGCATAQPAPMPDYKPYVERTVAVADLIGRSPAEVRRLIGARETDHDYVSEVRLASDGQRVMRTVQDLTHGGGPCPYRSSEWYRWDSKASRFESPGFFFRDDRLERVAFPSGDPAAADERIVVSCGPLETADPTTEVFALAIFGPWAVFDAAAKLPETASRASTRADLAKLRLGEPPPEGLDAYARKSTAGVEVRMGAPGEALVRIDLGRDPSIHGDTSVRVDIAGGRVVAIAKYGGLVPCWIEADRSLRCADAAAPL
jgi:hypothetical protein